ncbi:MAG: choice-of-anchor V domain-containing protein [Flavobacteriales bacterium]
MKKRIATLLSLLSVPAFILFTSGTVQSTGKVSASGSPGESTCSLSGCHGAGVFGIADNAGPGSISIVASPPFVGNKYIPGTTYHLSVIVSQNGSSLFGFNFEALDNSGNTNPNINNSTGSIDITDAASTQMVAFNGNGRINVMHQKNGGAAADSKSFDFDWTAPSSGIVNLYAAGIAANKIIFNDDGDNVYSTSIQLSPDISNNAIIDSSVDFAEVNLYGKFLILKFHPSENEQVSAHLFNTEGLLVKELFNKTFSEGDISEVTNTENLSSGVYLLKMSSDKHQRITTRKIFIP